MHDPSYLKQDIKLFDFEEKSIDRPSPSSDISSEVDDDESSIFYDAHEFDSHLDVRDKGSAQLIPSAVSMEPNDMLCSAYINMYQRKTSGYETLFAFVIDGALVFHTLFEFCKHFHLKDHHIKENNLYRSRHSSLEKQRRFMGSYIGTLLRCGTAKGLADVRKFLQSASMYSSDFLSHLNSPLPSYNESIIFSIMLLNRVRRATLCNIYIAAPFASCDLNLSSTRVREILSTFSPCAKCC